MGSKLLIAFLLVTNLVTARVALTIYHQQKEARMALQHARQLETARRTAFANLYAHAFYGPLYRKLTKTDIQAADAFFDAHGSLPLDQYCHEVQRWFVDQPKPKNWTAVNELLLVAGTQVGCANYGWPSALEEEDDNG